MKSCFDLLSYDDICAFEAMRVYKNFLPYAGGTPSDAATYENRYPDELTGYRTDQYKRANFVFFCDSHTDLLLKDESLDNVKRTIDFANNSPVKFDALIHAGDVLTPFGLVEKDEAIKRANRFFDAAKESESPLVFAKGNHDLNDWDNLPDRILTDKDWGNLFLDYAEEKYGIIRQIKNNGNKSTWHYIDIDDKKIRIVSVDIQDTDKSVLTEGGTVKLHGGKSWYIAREQMDWIISQALNFDEKEEKDWGVIFVMHQLSENMAFHESSVEMLLNVCEAFNNSKTYEHSYIHPENPFFNQDISADFSRYSSLGRKPHIICWLVGHVHEDIHEVRHGINIIYTVNNSATINSSDPRVVRIPGTVTQNCFDILNVDTYHRKIRMFRYGAGVNCNGKGGDRFLPDGLSY